MYIEGMQVVKEAEERKKKSLYNSIVDGMAYSIMVGFGESIAVPFALAMKATPLQVGILTTLPILLGALIQLQGAGLLSAFRNRKRIILPFVFLQGIMWAVIASIPFVFRENTVWILVLFYCVYIMFGQIVSPAWNSLMADIVSPRERGSYFGKRNALTGLAALTATLAAGFFLNLYPIEYLFIGFASLFAIAMIYRLVSLAYLKKMHEPEYFWCEEKEPTFFDFLGKAKKTNFGLFVLFIGFMNFSVYIASPFFTPYMLEGLGFNYLLFVVVNSASTLGSIIVMKRWGVNSDVFGNRKVLALTGILVSFVPVLWVFSPDPVYLIAAQLFSGFAWAGFNLAAANFLYDSLEPGRVARYLAYQNIIVGAMVVAGGLAGSFMIESLEQPFFSSNYLFVFFVSSVFRLIVAAVFISRIKEVRKEVQPISKRNLFFKIVTIRPMEGLVHEAVHDAVIIRKRLLEMGELQEAKALRKKFSKMKEKAKGFV